jgi:5-amino-6-(5-phospho-D-ribitylamino)uracil phosphatase
VTAATPQGDTNRLQLVPPHYDMLAVDLDGTLVNSRGEISPANAAAIRAAREAGMTIAVCTGRGLAECIHFMEGIGQIEPVAVAGGSIIACPLQRRTIHRFSLEPELVARAVERLLTHNHPVMILKDPAHAGYDYLMVIGEQRLALDPVTVWWLERMNVTHRFACSIAEDEHPEHTVRLGVCGLSGVLQEIIADLDRAFGAHDGQKLHILEVFDKRASKWSAIQWMAAQHGIPDRRICAIGDEINDLPMISQAGLGIAMGNAVPSVKAVAGRETLTNDRDGVAHAVARVLAGEW